MIRGVLSFVGLGIMAILLLGAIQGRMALTDVAIRGLVIVVAITVVDRVIVPVVGAAMRAVSPSSTDAVDDGMVRTD